jgi:diguanylate cyclase (GGDEF)-like protein
MDTKKRTVGIFSLRNRILLFSVLVTLVPSFGMGKLFYTMTYRATADVTEQKLKATEDRIGYALGAWLTERYNELHVFASSFIISDNLTKYFAAVNGHQSQDAAAQKRLVSYLSLIKGQYADYTSLLLLDAEGHLIAAAGADHPPPLPADWKSQVQASGGFAAEAFSSAENAPPRLTIGISLPAGPSVPLCLLVMEVNPEALRPIMHAVLAEAEAGDSEVMIANNEGRPLVAVAPKEGKAVTLLNSERSGALWATPNTMQIFVGESPGVAVAFRFRDLPWGCIIARDYHSVFAGVLGLRDRITLVAVLFALAIGLSASIVAGQILLPLKTLMHGVLRVANGELDVVLTPRRNDEFGIVTAMFNQMVVRLKEDQYELEQLATIDSITGLANRNQIMTSLNTHIEQYQRHATGFSLLMMDIDHFKAINDTYGHLVGDKVLSEIGRIFRQELRNIDTAGRYGGEEFLVILGLTASPEALVTAERIRKVVEGYSFSSGEGPFSVTISVGVTEIMGYSDTQSSMIHRADSALYQAKTGGRNRVVLSSPAAGAI